MAWLGTNTLIVLVFGVVLVGFGDGLWKLYAMSGYWQDLEDTLPTARARRILKAFRPRLMFIGIHTFLFINKELKDGPRRVVANMIDSA